KFKRRSERFPTCFACTLTLLRANWDKVKAVDFEPREAALIDLAQQANRKPHAVTDARFHTIRETGAQDAEIVEALGVMEVFAAFNRFSDTLQVAIDF
ncbi:MAG: hypothetical protein EA424_19740, partial [Planctomycetaceae bacterium]